MNPMPAIITMLPTLFGLIFGSYQWWMTVWPVLMAMFMSVMANAPIMGQMKYTDGVTDTVYVLMFVGWFASVVTSLYCVAVGV